MMGGGLTLLRAKTTWEMVVSEGVFFDNGMEM